MMKSLIIVVLGLFLSLPSPVGNGYSLWSWLIEVSMGVSINTVEGFSSSPALPFMLLLPVIMSYLYLTTRLPQNNKVRPFIQAFGGVVLWYLVVAVLYRYIPWMNIIIWVGLLVFEVVRMNYPPLKEVSLKATEEGCTGIQDHYDENTLSR